MINKKINMRTSLTIPKDPKTKLEIFSKEDNRSVNNLIINILDKYVETELNSMDNKME